MKKASYYLFEDRAYTQNKKATDVIDFYEKQFPGTIISARQDIPWK